MRSGMNEVQATDIRQPGVSPERALTKSVGLTIRARVDQRPSPGRPSIPGSN